MEPMASKPYDLESELMSCDWIKEKVKDDVYAQNLYAALCNNQFVKNDVLPILKEEVWSCSWRYAGGLVSDLTGQGDYLSYYCSGITDIIADDLPEPYRKKISKYKPEGHVSEEIKQDLFKLGWIIFTEDK